MFWKRNKDKAAKPAPERNDISEWMVTFVTLLFVSTSLGWSFVVPTGSMESTILIGDHLFVDKLAYQPSGSFTQNLLPYQDVKRGDIIVFKYPLDTRIPYVKRVIGVPGDRIRIQDKQLILNGKAVQEPYKQHVQPDVIAPYRDNFPFDVPIGLNRPSAEIMIRDHVKNGELVVPAGHYFAMGDNRDNSDDSRFWGFVPRENVIGKPLICWWSFQADTTDITGFSLTHIFNVITKFIPNTRWDRQFRIFRGYELQ
jgi:signal peptidase I